MCGRFAFAPDLETLEQAFPEVKMGEDFLLRYNIAPTQKVPTILNDGHKHLTHTRWGLIPAWAKDASIGSKMINARAETLAEKPSFRTPLRRQRCLILATGFYEWQALPGQKKKQPLYICLSSGQPFAFAGLWDKWRTTNGEVWTTSTIITTAPNSLMAPIHDRMPVILAAEDYELWLTPGEASVDKLQSCLRPYPPELMTAFAVSTAINNPAVDGVELLAPMRDSENV